MRTGIRQECSLLPLLITQILAMAIRLGKKEERKERKEKKRKEGKKERERKRKRKKRHQIRREEVKLFLFADDMILYIQNSTE